MRLGAQRLASPALVELDIVNDSVTYPRDSSCRLELTGIHLPFVTAALGAQQNPLSARSSGLAGVPTRKRMFFRTETESLNLELVDRLLCILFGEACRGRGRGRGSYLEGRAVHAELLSRCQQRGIYGEGLSAVWVNLKLQSRSFLPATLNRMD